MIKPVHAARWLAVAAAPLAAAALAVALITPAAATSSRPAAAATAPRCSAADLEVWVAADHSKFNRPAMVELARLAQIDMLFTDATPPEPFPALLAEAGVQSVISEH